MRVNGNLSPDVLSISPYEPQAGKVEVKIRENITEFEQQDEMSGQTIKGYTYDEYTFIVDNSEGLAERINANLSDWLITGRTLEVDPNATLYLTAKADAVDEYTEQLIEEGLL